MHFKTVIALHIMLNKLGQIKFKISFKFFFLFRGLTEKVCSSCPICKILLFFKLVGLLSVSNKINTGDKQLQNNKVKIIILSTHL